MRKLIFIIAFLITSFVFAQGGPKVDVIKFRGEVTTTVRNTFNVPIGETWFIYNVTTGLLEYANDDDVWDEVNVDQAVKMKFVTTAQRDALVVDGDEGWIVYNIDTQSIEWADGNNIWYTIQSGGSLSEVDQAIPNNVTRDITIGTGTSNVLFSDGSGLTGGRIMEVTRSEINIGAPLLPNPLTNIGSNTEKFNTIYGKTGDYENIRLEPTDIEPFSSEGYFYADNSENRPKYYDGTSWKAFLLDGDVGGGTIGGTIADNQIAVGGATANTIEGSDFLTFSNGNFRIQDNTSKSTDKANVFVLETNDAGFPHQLKIDRKGVGTPRYEIEAINQGVGFTPIILSANGGKVGIGAITTPTEELEVGGNVKASGSFIGDGSTLTGVGTSALATDAVTSVKVQDGALTFLDMLNNNASFAGAIPTYNNLGITWVDPSTLGGGLSAEQIERLGNIGKLNFLTVISPTTLANTNFEPATPHRGKENVHQFAGNDTITIPIGITATTKAIFKGIDSTATLTFEAATGVTLHGEDKDGLTLLDGFILNGKNSISLTPRGDDTFFVDSYFTRNDLVAVPVAIYAGDNAADPSNELNNTNGFINITGSTTTSSVDFANNGTYSVKNVATNPFNVEIRLDGVANTDNVTVTFDFYTTNMSGNTFSWLRVADGWDVQSASTIGALPYNEWRTITLTATATQADPILEISGTSSGTFYIDNIVITQN